MNLVRRIRFTNLTILLIAVSVLLFVVNANAIQFETEPNNNSTVATTITSGTPFQGNLFRGDVDYFALPAISGNTITASITRITNDNSWFYYSFKGPSNNTLYHGFFNSKPSVSNSTGDFTINAVVNGTYYLLLTGDGFLNYNATVTNSTG